MRICILSDVHSNLPALEAVLRHAAADRAVDAVWCLGDIVGYAAQPSETIALLRRQNLTAVAGNHDLAAAGAMDTDLFNPVAAEAAAWTANQLSESERAFLLGLPLTTIVGDVTMVHGSLREPVWEYLLDAEQAAAQFALQTTPYSVIGHSHLPFWAVQALDGRPTAVQALDDRPTAEERGPSFYPATDGTTLHLGDARLIVNPGSAGQPRDGDPRVSYVLYDDDASVMTWHRVEYDIRTAQEKIWAAGLPRYLGDRLATGR